MKYYYKTADKTIELFETPHLMLTHRGITELVCPPCELLDCSYNNIQSLIIPDGCNSVYCIKNKLKTIEIPNSLLILKCSLNFLTSIKSDNLKILECNGNKIDNLSINTKCCLQGIDQFNFPKFIMDLLNGNKAQFDLGINLCRSLYKNKI